MQIYKGLEHIRKTFQNTAVTIGNFDGVHKGHQAILHQVIEKAESIGGTSMAITFDPHPIRVLKKNGDPPVITLFEQKAELIEKIGIDALVCISFDEKFAAMTADRFLSDILIHTLGMKAIVIGEDYTFGKNRQGDIHFLKDFSARYGYEVIVAGWVPVSHQDMERISSTRVRELVMAGDVEKARQLLGRHYQIRGTVVSGRNRGGRLLGFPTANIHLQDELCPKTGVYAVTVQSNGSTYKGVANIGYSPTFDDQMFTVEVHLLDFSGDIYGQKIKVNFIGRIRDEKKFENIEQLSRQIQADIQTARSTLTHM